MKYIVFWLFQYMWVVTLLLQTPTHWTRTTRNWFPESGQNVASILDTKVGVSGLFFLLLSQSIPRDCFIAFSLPPGPRRFASAHQPWFTRNCFYLFPFLFVFVLLPIVECIVVAGEGISWILCSIKEAVQTIQQFLVFMCLSELLSFLVPHKVRSICWKGPTSWRIQHC